MIKKLSILLFFITLTSCSQPKEINDCSTIFEKSQPTSVTPAQCKVLPIKFEKNNNCEISGSDKIDNLLALYKQNPGNRMIMIAPVKQLLGGDISLKDKIKYYFIMMKIRQHFDSGIATSLKDFRYKGAKCEMSGNTLIVWFGDETIFASYEEKTPQKKNN